MASEFLGKRSYVIPELSGKTAFKVFSSPSALGRIASIVLSLHKWSQTGKKETLGF